MEIETQRLRIILLSVDQLGLLLSDKSKLEKQLGLNASDTTMNEPTRHAMEYLFQHSEKLKNGENSIGFTNWQIVLKPENKIIASACFKHDPNENGEVEIGYGTDENYRNRGYMTEAVQAMCDFALHQPHVKAVIAETEKDNIASHRVLQKCGMVVYKEEGESLWWRV